MEIVMTLMHRHGNKKVFTSDHPVDKYTSLTLIGMGCILLEDCGMVALRLLDCSHAGALCVVLKGYLSFKVVDDATENLLFPLTVDYGDRSNPYCNGIVLSMNGVSVFLGKNEVNRLINSLS